MKTETRWYFLPKGHGIIRDVEFVIKAEKAGNVLSNVGMANWLNGNTENPADIVKYDFVLWDSVAP